MKSGAISKTDVAPGAPNPEASANVTKVVILVFGTVIVLAIVFFLFALSNMPS